MPRIKDQFYSSCFYIWKEKSGKKKEIGVEGGGWGGEGEMEEKEEEKKEMEILFVG